jgi:hypothetical protein
MDFLFLCDESTLIEEASIKVQHTFREASNIIVGVGVGQAADFVSVVVGWLRLHLLGLQGHYACPGALRASAMQVEQTNCK